MADRFVLRAYRMLFFFFLLSVPRTPLLSLDRLLGQPTSPGSHARLKANKNARSFTTASVHKVITLLGAYGGKEKNFFAIFAIFCDLVLVG